LLTLKKQKLKILFSYREWKESQIVDETLPDKKGDYPVILVDRVNHAQVAAGEKHFACFQKSQL
jgi:hypothetical protein